MYAQVDEDGHRFLLLAEIVVYLCNPNTVVKEKYSYLSNKTDQKVRIYTTEGWGLLVIRKDENSRRVIQWK